MIPAEDTSLAQHPYRGLLRDIVRDPSGSGGDVDLLVRVGVRCPPPIAGADRRHHRAGPAVLGKGFRDRENPGRQERREDLESGLRGAAGE